MRLLTTLAGILIVLSGPALARADVPLVTEDGFEYEIQEYSSYGGDGGEISSGGTTSTYQGAWSTMFKLEVNDIRYVTTSSAYKLTAGGRQVELSDVKIAGIYVRREVYVPKTIGEYVRYIDVFRNPANKPVTVTVTISGRTAYNSNLITTSSHDVTVTTNDTWFSMDDAVDGGGPVGINYPCAMVVAGTGGEVLKPLSISQAGALMEWQFSLTIPAYGQRAIMTFGTQGNSRAAVAAEAARIVSLPADTLVGADEYLSDVVNFQVGGAPIVRASVPYELAEGTPIHLGLDIVDREDDDVEWSWDLDGNGVFGEAANDTTPSIPAGVTDGNRDWEISIKATDGVHTRTRSYVVHVTNVVPEITSLPDLRDVSIGELYEYDLVVTDPATTRDPIVYQLVSGPTGTVISNTGKLTWTPTVADRGTTASFEVAVNDGDGGSTSQTWELGVVENRPPGPPTPISPLNVEVYTQTPTLRVANGADPDGDTLIYRFRVDRISTFDSEDLFESADVKERKDETAWTLPVGLEPAVYYWQVRSFDGYVESAPRGGRFVWAEGKGNVLLPDSGVEPLPIPDVGVHESRPECAVRAVGAGTSSPWALSVMACVAVGLMIRRRRSR